MSKRKEIPECLSTILVNEVPKILFRLLKSSDYYYSSELNKFSYDYYFNRINNRLNSYANGNLIKTYEDLMRFEIDWYEKGGCPPYFGNYNFKLRTKEGKFDFIVGFFIDDLLGCTHISNQITKADMINLLMEIKKIYI